MTAAARDESSIRLPGRLRKAVSELGSTLAPYWLIVRLLPSVHLALTLVTGLGVVTGSLIPVITTISIGHLSGAVPPAIQAGRHSDAARTAMLWLLFVGAMFVVTGAVASVRSAAAFSLGRRLNEHLRERLVRALNQPTGIAHLEEPGTKDLVQRAQDLSGYGYTPRDTVRALANQGGTWLQALGHTLLLARFNPLLAVGLFLATAVASHFYRREYLRSTEVMTRQALSVRRADYLRNLVLAPPAAKEIRIWNLTNWLIAHFSDEWQRVIHPVWTQRAAGTRIHALTTISLYVLQFLVLASVGLAAARGNINISSLVIYAAAVQAIGGILGRSADDFFLAYGTATIPALLELERIAREAQAGEKLRGILSPDGMPSKAIRFEGVTFRYPGQSSDVLCDLDLEIPAGRSLAIVGANGAGKTTLVKLLGRLYDPGEGRIVVDGVELRDIEPRGWQRRVSAIFQDFVQYQLSARDNVTFGAVEHADDETALIDAARKSGALESIHSLPDGWSTPLSRQYRRGAELSGGQWQRLAMARALFAVSHGASVLVMDEPTANLDVRAEAAFFDRFLDITTGLTTIVISHRFSTVRRADRIVVLESGRIIEDGSHDELVAKGGRYAEMFNLQASRFSEEAPDA